MKKALIGAASVLTVVLAGCGNNNNFTPTTKDDNKAEYRIHRNSSSALWIDPETKCEYIGGSVSAAMTPRLDRNGKHICR